MAKCTRCGFRLDDGAKFCSRCGAQLVQNIKLNKTDGKTFSINSNSTIHFSKEMIDYINVMSVYLKVIDENRSVMAPIARGELDDILCEEGLKLILSMIIDPAIEAGLEILSEYDLDDDYDRKELVSQTLSFSATRFGCAAFQECRSALNEDDIESVHELLKRFAEAIVCDAGVYIYNLLVQEQCLSPVAFMKNCAFEDTKYKKWDKTNEQANQIFSEYTNKNLSAEDATNKLCKCISEYPQCAIAYAYIYAIDHSASAKLSEVAKFCGMEQEFQRFLDSEKEGTFNFLIWYSGRNPRYL